MSQMGSCGRMVPTIMETGSSLQEHAIKSGSIRKKKMEWFSQGVPCYAFITWLVFHDRLYTGHSTRRWCQPQGCFFCGEPYETREHLFFACPYTFMLWLQVVRNLFGVEPDPDWDITISRLLTGKYDCLLLFC